MIRRKLWGEEFANIRKALLFLAERSTPAQLAEALGMTAAALQKARSPSRRPSGRLATRVARAAGVNVWNVLMGAWPGDMYPKCGRSGGSTPGGDQRPHHRRAGQAQAGA